MENMTSLEQLLVGLLIFAGGLSGWLLPHDSKWNLLRLKRFFYNRVSESTNRKIPKVVGTLMMIIGLAFVTGALASGLGG